MDTMWDVVPRYGSRGLTWWPTWCTTCWTPWWTTWPLGGRRRWRPRGTTWYHVTDHVVSRGGPRGVTWWPTWCHVVAHVVYHVVDHVDHLLWGARGEPGGDPVGPALWGARGRPGGYHVGRGTTLRITWSHVVAHVVYHVLDSVVDHLASGGPKEVETTWDHVVPRDGPRGLTWWITWCHVVAHVVFHVVDHVVGTTCLLGSRRSARWRRLGTTWYHVTDHVVSRGGPRGVPRGGPRGRDHLPSKEHEERQLETTWDHVVPRDGPRGLTWWATWCTTWWTTWSGPLKTGHARAKRVTLIRAAPPTNSTPSEEFPFEGICTSSSCTRRFCRITGLWQPSVHSDVAF